MQETSLSPFNAPPISDMFNALSQGFRADDEGPFAGPWPRNPAAWRRQHKKYRRHESKAAQAERVLAKMNGLAPAQILAYLRKIDPYVFEELALCILERQGIAVVRNASYSGDGGLDGEFVHKGCRYLVQAKRYVGAVNAVHVESFAALIAERQAQGGLFIHTGRTPSSVYRALRVSKKVTLISGQKLVDLIHGQPLALWTAA